MIEIRVSMIIFHKNEILLVNHFRNGKNYWVLPGGKLRNVETLEECGEREIMEEACLQVKATKLLFTGETIWPDYKRHILNYFFKGEIISGVMRKPEWSFPDEHYDNPDFVPVDKLSEINFYPKISDIITRISQGEEIINIYINNLYTPY